MGLTKSLYADLSCEEVFELERHCDEVQREREDHERDLAEEEACWCKFFESCPTCFGKA